VRAEATSNRDALFLKNTHTERETATLVGASTRASPSLPATVGSRAWAARPAAPPPRLHRLSSTSAGATRARRPQLAAVCHPPASAAAAAAAAARAHEQLDLQVPLLALEDHSVPPKVPGALSLTSGSTRAPGPLDIHIIAGPGFFPLSSAALWASHGYAVSIL